MKSFYEEICKLKDIIRRGWGMNGVPKKRKESVAEHTFSAMLLALEIINKNNLELDQLKVLKMLAYHELCEIDAGDAMPMDNIKYETKFENEYAGIKRIAKSYNIPEIETLWLEFEKQTSPEGKFAKMIDKVDAILQAEIYTNKYKKQSILTHYINNSINFYNEFKKLNRK